MAIKTPQPVNGFIAADQRIPPASLPGRRDAGPRDDDSGFGDITAAAEGLGAELPRPVNWRTLTAADALYEWLALDEWVGWLRREFALPASVIPPSWHRHPELVWELSALHLHWLGAYDPDQHASAPVGWMADFHAARTRLREWVALSGTRLEVDRPARQTPWPGDDTGPTEPERTITNRSADFAGFVAADVARRAGEEAGLASRGESGLDDIGEAAP